jgi:hypothetical protein
MNRENMVDSLIEDDIKKIMKDWKDGDAEYLYFILKTRDGYDNWTLRQIIDEYNTRIWEEV